MFIKFSRPRSPFWLQIPCVTAICGLIMLSSISKAEAGDEEVHRESFEEALMESAQKLVETFVNGAYSLDDVSIISGEDLAQFEGVEAWEPLDSYLTNLSRQEPLVGVFFSVDVYTSCGESPGFLYVYLPDRCNLLLADPCFSEANPEAFADLATSQPRIEATADQIQSWYEL